MNRYGDLLPDRNDSIPPDDDITSENSENDEVLSEESLPAPLLMQWKPFPVGALPSMLSSYVWDVSKSIGCDPAFVALPLLSMLAAGIGTTRRVRLKSGWTEPCAVWTAIIGESGSQKSPALRQVSKSLKLFQMAQHARWQAAYHAYQVQEKMYDKEYSEWRRKGKSEGPPPEPPEPPVQVRYLVHDITVESLAPILNQNPRGLILACDELSGWLGSFNKYSGGRGADAAHWLSMFNGESITVDRKTTDPPTIFVPEALMSVTGSIQPGILWKLLGDEHRQNGLAARLLFCHPPQKPKKWSDQGVSSHLADELHQLVARLLELEPVVDPDTGNETALLLDLDAVANIIWQQFYDDHAERMAAKTGDVAAAYSKLEAYAPRFALIFQIVRSVLSPNEASSIVIDRDSMQRAATLARWFAEEAERLYLRRAQSDDDKRRSLLLDFAIEKGGTITVRDVSRSSLMKYFATSDDVERELHQLCSLNQMMRQTDHPGKSGGRPTNRFSIIDDSISE